MGSCFPKMKIPSVLLQDTMCCDLHVWMKVCHTYALWILSNIEYSFFSHSPRLELHIEVFYSFSISHPALFHIYFCSVWMISCQPKIRLDKRQNRQNIDMDVKWTEFNWTWTSVLNTNTNDNTEKRWACYDSLQIPYFLHIIPACIPAPPYPLTYQLVHQVFLWHPASCDFSPSSLWMMCPSLFFFICLPAPLFAVSSFSNPDFLKIFCGFDVLPLNIPCKIAILQW